MVNFSLERGTIPNGEAALLGAPIFGMVAHLLVDHQDFFGQRYVSSISFWDDMSKAETRDWHHIDNMVIHAMVTIKQRQM
jgi:hypothetical protein